MPKFLFILLCLGLVGCTLQEAPYHYHRQVTVWGRGYVDTKLSPGTWYVSYRGHHMTNTQARDLALLRAAYLCSCNGYSWFRVATPNSDQGWVYNQIGKRVRYPESTMIVCGLHSSRRGAFNSSELLISLMRKYRISQAELTDWRALNKGKKPPLQLDILDM